MDFSVVLCGKEQIIFAKVKLTTLLKFSGTFLSKISSGTASKTQKFHNSEQTLPFTRKNVDFRACQEASYPLYFSREDLVASNDAIAQQARPQSPWRTKREQYLILR